MPKHKQGQWSSLFGPRIFCEVCGKSFQRWHPRYRQCKKCRNAAKRAKQGSRAAGFYVYGWYYPNDVLPFYIGKGCKSRAWRKFSNGRQRETVIYRDGLTEDEAYLVESVLISVFLKLGAPLINRAGRPPTRRLTLRA